MKGERDRKKKKKKKKVVQQATKSKMDSLFSLSLLLAPVWIFFLFCFTCNGGGRGS